MSSLSNDAVGLLPIASASPATTIGGAALFAGVFLLFMGFNEYADGSSTRDKHRASASERDVDINAIMTKAMDSGLAKIGVGVVAVLVGVGIAATGRTPSRETDQHAS